MTKRLLLTALASAALNSAAPAQEADEGLEQLADGVYQLDEGSRLYSPNRHFNLAMQPDGNVVLYKGEQFLWGSYNDLEVPLGKGPQQLLLSKGRLYLVRGENTVWSSNVGGEDPGAVLKLTDAGIVVVVGSDGTPLWAHHWEYGEEGLWPYLGDKKVQSPREVAKAGESEGLPGVYTTMTAKSVENNGHTFQLNYDSGSGGKLTSRGKAYDLLQFHFHSPSEHEQTGYPGWTDEKRVTHPGHYAMEVHFVHSDGSFKGAGSSAPEREDLAVVGVFIKEGAHNPALQKVWDECPDTKAEDTDLKFNAADGGFNASSLMPKGSAFRTYTGSLTTPPLSSGVSWFVMDEPIEASKEQIATLRKAMEHNTNRSIHGRLGPLGTARE